MNAYSAADALNLTKAVEDVGDLKGNADRCLLREREMKHILSRCIKLFKPDPAHILVPDLPHPRFWHAIFGLQVLNAFHSRFSSRPRFAIPSTFNILRDTVTENWSDIWRWVECGSVRCKRHKKDPLESHLYGWLFSNLIEFMAISFCQPQNLHFRNELSTQEMGPLVDLWYLQACNEDMDNDPTSVTTRIIYLSMPEEAELEWWNVIVARTGRPAEDVVANLLIQFHGVLCTSQLPKDSPVIGAHLGLIARLTNPEATNNVFLSLNSIYYFTRGLVHYSRVPPSHIPRAMTESTVKDFICLYLRESFELCNGITWIRRSLEAGLLVGIIRCVPRRKSRETEAPVLSRMITMITSYLVYVSILRPVARWIGSVDLERIERKMVQSGPFWEAWAKLKRLVLQRSTLAGTAMLTPCQNHKCDGTQESTRVFKRCGGCQDVSYCSTRCQRIDWTDDCHRSYCRRVRQFHKVGKGVELSEEDLAFAKLVIRDDLTKDRYGVQKKFGTPFPENVKLELDYLSLPPKITISKSQNTWYIATLPWGYGTHKFEMNKTAHLENVPNHSESSIDNVHDTHGQ